MTRLAALVPANTLRATKSRLAPLLTPEERDLLAHVMLVDVLQAVHASGVAEIVFVVSADGHLLEHAWEQGAVPVPEPAGGAGGLNPALELARRAALVERPEALLVVLADLPELRPEDLRAFVLPLPDGPRVRICPADDGGTNLLLLRPPDAIPFRYGGQSAAAHRAEAEVHGLPVEERRVPGASRDVDTPADVARLLREAGSTTTGVFLRRWGIDPEVAEEPARRLPPRTGGGLPAGEKPARLRRDR